MLLQDSLQVRNEGRQFHLHHLPDDLGVDAVIAVDDVVAHAAHVLPWNVRRSLLDGLGHVAGRLADHREVPHDGLQGPEIVAEFGERHPGDERPGFRDRLKDVADAEGPRAVLRRHRRRL